MNGRDVVVFPAVDLPRLTKLAELLHERLPEQVVIGLQGTLGAGKTRLAQAIAVAAGIDVSDVTSPTFTLVQHYHGSRSIHHVDAYRLADEDEFAELGGEELLEDQAMVLVEWPQRITRSLPGHCLMLDIEIDEGSDPSAGATPGSHDPNAGSATRTIRASSGDGQLMAIMHDIRTVLDEYQ